jgi:hypothetical protein
MGGEFDALLGRKEVVVFILPERGEEISWAVVSKILKRR